MRRLKLIAAAAVAVLAAACSSMPIEEASLVAQPDGPANPARTRFQEGLVCMDRLLADYGWSNVPLLVSGVPDHTGQVLVASKDWLQGSFQRMSAVSGAFRIVDYDPLPDAPEQALYSLLPPEMQNTPIPAMYVRGAISGFAESVASRTQGVSVALGENADGALARDQVFSIVSVDLSVGMFLSRTLVNRAYSSNEITLQTRQRATDVGGAIGKFGLDYNFQANRKDGLPQAVRTLIDLGAIEVAGRLTGAPYWTCLGATLDQPEVKTAAQTIFADMVPADRIGFAQRRLGRLGAYAGPVDGQPSEAFVSALAAWQGSAGVAPSGRVDEATYLALVGGAGRAAPSPSPAQSPAPSPLPSAPAAPEAALAPVRPAPLSLTLGLASRLRPGAPVDLRARASGTAFLYCYLQGADRRLSRVFPNADQPDPLVPGGAEVAIPGPGARFEILPEPAEQVVCFASDRDVGAFLPPAARAEDLTPLGVDFDTLASEFRRSAERLGGSVAVDAEAISPE